jgi:hypothetical protein
VAIDSPRRTHENFLAVAEHEPSRVDDFLMSSVFSAISAHSAVNAYCVRTKGLRKVISEQQDAMNTCPCLTIRKEH